MTNLTREQREQLLQLANQLGHARMLVSPELSQAMRDVADRLNDEAKTE